mmetsp:Transcript_44316/g.73833  ORF Transcript_44316/g.73833 Transcript_44316/m.73833 type:complete len:161 (+) Transcript_44316:217-699(+)
MSHPSDDETRVVLRKLAYFIASFYVLYYTVALVYMLGFDLPFERFGYIPFNFEKEDFKPALRGRGELDRELPLASWLALVTTMPLTTVLIFFIVKNTRKAWDYAVTISFTHLVACIIVRQAFPLNWIWWLSMAVTTFMLSSLSEMSIYYLHDMKEIELEN